MSGQSGITASRSGLDGTRVRALTGMALDMGAGRVDLEQMFEPTRGKNALKRTCGHR